MTKPYRAPTKPMPKPCPDCGRKVLAGLDDRAAALPVVIDAAALTREGELVNIVNGVAMYGTTIHNEILRRTPGEVLHHVASLTMHRVHDCAEPTPPAFIKSLPTKPAATITDEVPF